MSDILPLGTQISHTFKTLVHYMGVHTFKTLVHNMQTIFIHFFISQKKIEILFACKSILQKAIQIAKANQTAHR